MAEYGLLFLRRFLYEKFCCAFEGQSECLDEEILFGLSYATLLSWVCQSIEEGEKLVCFVGDWGYDMAN